MIDADPKTQLVHALDRVAVTLGTPFANRLAEMARSDSASRQAMSVAMTELGFSSSAAQLEASVEVTVECIRRCIADHDLTESELGVVRTIKRLCGIEEGDILRLRPADVSDLLREAMEVVLRDIVVTGKEAAYKVGLQEAFGLSYDEFYDLTLEQFNAVLRALKEEIAPEGRRLSEREFRELQRRGAHLDSVFRLDVSIVDETRVGHVYALTNASMPGLVKVGMTTRAPGERAAELSASTGVPTPFAVVFDIAVNDVFEAENAVHDRLTMMGYRLTGDREFFNAPLKTVIAVMTEVGGVAPAPMSASSSPAPTTTEEDFHQSVILAFGLAPITGNVHPEVKRETFLRAAHAATTVGMASAPLLRDRLSVSYREALILMDRLRHFGVVEPSGEEPRAFLGSLGPLPDMMRAAEFDPNGDRRTTRAGFLGIG